MPGIADLLPDFSLLLVDLSKTSNEELRSWALEAFPKAALFALRDARDPAKLLQDFDHWGALLGEASEAPAGMDAIRQLIQYIAQASPNLNIKDFRGKIRQYLPKAEAELMTIYEQARQVGLQQGIEQGIEQGIGQGIEQGIHRGRIEQLLELLELKFGELPSEYAARLQSATATDIHRYAKRMLTADSLAAVFADPA